MLGSERWSLVSFTVLDDIGLSLRDAQIRQCITFLKYLRGRSYETTNTAKHVEYTL